ncbi:hypothetical protein [Mesorhizobium sp.]|uniref:hypothetical protein n=1 Tax=Mesorhizobium sp. TaxID=1871066 RepID=UPI000FE60F1A|nr:hypothetical protein [Mesorhizobium sp.]RWC61681.1 MAG: hypothetical protein EOS29_18130 [Mesorhizobium sp.]
MQFYAQARETRRNALAHPSSGCNRFSESIPAMRKIFLLGGWSGFKLLPQALIYGSFSAGREMPQNSFF